MTLLLAIAAICTVPQEAGALVRDEATTLEVNFHHNECDGLAFMQLIWWDNTPDPVVVAWRIPKAVQIERRGEWWVATWMDGEALRSVRARYFKRTWTPGYWGDGDPELAHRAIVPKEQRRELTTAPQRTARVLKWWRW